MNEGRVDFERTEAIRQGSLSHAVRTYTRTVNDQRKASVHRLGENGIKYRSDPFVPGPAQVADS